QQPRPRRPRLAGVDSAEPAGDPANALDPAALGHVDCRSVSPDPVMRALIATFLVAACGKSGDPHPIDSSTVSCNTASLHTGLVAQQTGVSADAFDCEILKWTAGYHEPDAMIFKGIIYVESRFDKTSIACPNLPCGMPPGWTAMESGCFGLMQIVPACDS